MLRAICETCICGLKSPIVYFTSVRYILPCLFLTVTSRMRVQDYRLLSSSLYVLLQVPKPRFTPALETIEEEVEGEVEGNVVASNGDGDAI